MMAYRFVVYWVVALLSVSYVAAQTANVDLIPRPNQMKVQPGLMNLQRPIPVVYHEEFKDLSTLIAHIPDLFVQSYDVAKRDRRDRQHRIRLLKASDADRLSSDSYRISIDDRGIFIRAHTEETMRSAIFTLHQLRLLQGENNALPFLEIEDAPRFAYRGLHLDVSRHFFPFDFLKKYIDIMALYKFNHFHWHLTDGAGWRLEINQYPELTSKAAWRSHRHFTDWDAYGRQYVEKGTPNAYGGYYTQAQARELVAYAAAKGITVIPEIEMPGHSEEVLAVYPELSCSGEPYTQNEFCVGNEQTYVFLKNVLDEVLDIFPSPYIHIGGDEADKTHWKTCPKCQALKEREGLEDEDELQSYAVRQMDKYLQSKGRKMIGWDEILEGGLTEGATVMSWRGEEGGIKAANMGHDVIMTPLSHLYFDFYQFDPRTQPKAFGGYLPLERVYAYNPLSDQISEDKAKHVLGAQANLWAEHLDTYQQVEYMAFPRALALAEINWTKQEQRNFDDFKRRLQSHYRILQDMEVNYYRPSFDVTYQVDFDSVKMSNKVILTSEQYQPIIRYAIDGSEPTKESYLYTLPFDLSTSTTIKAASFLDSTRVSPVTTIDLDIHKAIGKKVVYNSKWNDSYPAQENMTLTNGRKGGITYHDGQWQGFTQDIDVVIDLDRREEINRVAADFMQMPEPGVFFPGEIKVLVSDNGKNFREVGTVVNHYDPKTPVLKMETFEILLDKPVMTRYVKFLATNKQKGFLFIDEVVVD